MSTHFVADVPVECQEGGVVQLLMEVLEVTDKDRGVFLYYLLADGTTNGFDDWFIDRATLEKVALEDYGVDPRNWRVYIGPFPDCLGQAP